MTSDHMAASVGVSSIDSVLFMSEPMDMVDPLYGATAVHTEVSFANR